MTVTAEPTSPACPRCGSAMPGDAPAGLCPRCLLSDGFGIQSEGDFRLRTGQPGPRFVPPTIDELAGEFPHLEFVQLLGSGGMGAVYLAKQIRLDRRVAVKVLPPDLADDPAFAERFLREARALARLSHPNIVGVYDFGQTPGGLYYFLMEYIEGPTLRQVVANRSTEPKQALEIVRQVCDALQFAHDKGVVHRDIKPENILLDAHGRVKIADFGLAKLLGIAEPQPGSPAAGSLTHTRQAMGTPHYMAPEQIAGSRGVDHRADIYSLGVVFYELLTGELPVGRFAPPSKKVHVDVRLDEVVLRSLEAEPSQRYQRASDVKTDVESISSGSANARPRAADGTGPDSLTKSATLAVFAVAFLIAGVVGAVNGEELFLFVGGCFGISIGAMATSFGLTAVKEIRHAGGRRSGLVAAVAAALAAPVSLLCIVLAGICLVLGLIIQENVFHNFNDADAVALGMFVAVPVCFLGSLLLIRWGWCKATAGLPAEFVERERGILPLGVRSFFAAIPTPFDHARKSPTAPSLPMPVPLGAVYRQEPAVRQESRAAAASAVSDVVDVGRPRTSIKAIVGAIWAVLALGVAVAVIAGGTVSVRPVATDSPPAPVWVIIIPLAILVVGVLVPAPFVVTILGWSAVSDIRQSSGRLIGLPLAVLDGLCFPLLLLDAVVAVPVTAGLVWIAYEGFSVDQHDYGPLHVAVIGLIVLGIVAAIDAVIAFLVWRRVKASMPPTGTAQPETPPPTGQEARIEPVAPRRHRDLVMAGVAITVALVLVGLQVLFENGFPEWRSNQPATVADNYAAPATMAAPMSAGGVEAMPGAITEEDRHRGWRMTPNGPEILPQWAANMLALYDQVPAGVLDPNLADTPEPINAALQHVYADYEEVLDDHTSATFEGDAVVFTIEPFPEELDRLTNEFWSRVDPLLHVEQQKILRYNFPLRYSQRHRLRSHRHNFVLPIGDGRWTIRIERSGQWYRWSAKYPSAPPGTTDSPELPQYLRRFQHEYDRLLSLRNDGLTFDPQRLPLVAPKPAGTSSPVASPSEPPHGFAGMEMMSGSAEMGMMPGPGMEAMGDMSGYAEMGAMPGFGMDMYGGISSEPAGTDDELPLPDRLQRWGLDPKAVAVVVDTVNEIERDYHAVLDEHTQVDVNGTSVAFATQPFPEQIDRLERRFWQQVDPLLNVEQQRILRNSFPVGEPWYSPRDAATGQFGSGVGRMGSGFDQHSSTKPGLLMIGHGVTRLSIERVGQWYRWQLEGGVLGESMHVRPPQETPSLPRWLRRFQERYDELVPRSK